MKVLIDIDDTTAFYTKAHAYVLNASPQVKFPQSLLGFFANLEPDPEAIAAIELFRALPGVSVYFATAPSVCNLHCYTEKAAWVERWYGRRGLENLIIALDKSMLIGDVLIDDRSTGRGQENFKGKLIHFGSEEYPDWKSVEEVVLGLYNSRSALLP